jgi:hypothetical protein
LPIIGRKYYDDYREIRNVTKLPGSDENSIYQGEWLKGQDVVDGRGVCVYSDGS